MIQLLEHGERINKMSGRSILRAFDAGVIPQLISEGWTLTEAMEIAREAGHLSFESEKKNLIVTVGSAMVASVLAGNLASTLLFTYQAIGTGTTAPSLSDTELSTEVARNAIVTKTQSGNVIQLSTYFVKAICSYNIKEAALFGNLASATADSGTMFNHYLQEYDNSAGLKDLTFIYNLEV